MPRENEEACVDGSVTLYVKTYIDMFCQAGISGMAKKQRAGVKKGSGNVFADLGFRNSKQEMLKARLTVEIYKLLSKRGITQSEAAKLLGTTQAQVSALMRCRPVSVSVGRLMEFLNVLGQDIEVTVKPAPRRKVGDMSVVVRA